MDENNEKGYLTKYGSLDPVSAPKNGSSIFTALLAVQAELPKLKKDASNPFFKSKYVTLETVIDVVLPILNKNNIVLIQQPTTVFGQPGLTTTLVHINGSQVSSTMLLTMVKSDPQAQGSAITYARRYALMSLLGLIGEEDDDGNAANDPDPEWVKEKPLSQKLAAEVEKKTCDIHDVPMFHGVSKDKFTKEGKPKEYWYHKHEGQMCFGN